MHASRVESVDSISTRDTISASASTECVTTYANEHIDTVNTDAYSNAVPHKDIATPHRIISSSAATSANLDGRTYPVDDDFRGVAGARSAAAKAHSCRCCTSKSNTGVVKIHSRTRSAEKDVAPLDAGTETYQSSPRHISRWVKAATAEMYATWRLSRRRDRRADHTAALRLKTRATTKTTHATRAESRRSSSEESADAPGG